MGRRTADSLDSASTANAAFQRREKHACLHPDRLGRGFRVAGCWCSVASLARPGSPRLLRARRRRHACCSCRRCKTRHEGALCPTGALPVPVPAVAAMRRATACHGGSPSVRCALRWARLRCASPSCALSPSAALQSAGPPCALPPSAITYTGARIARQSLARLNRGRWGTLMMCTANASRPSRATAATPAPREFFHPLPPPSQPGRQCALANACPCRAGFLIPDARCAMLPPAPLVNSLRRPLQPDFCQKTTGRGLFCPTASVASIGQECC
ncbi:hypothetical protein K458DRAFT_454356 [Lentithecium fluviatile CBS 122367]|uniref:Uncharacterized protein n=1 Tax=Lentithecium fluviatile CBS 122367 TaxID=1168545 RepID=A0A6G1IW14_9PLEO|nr:hypothetical protein K458DRAFT_454356 [Lentithecium fluviatile CBS 122367]